LVNIKILVAHPIRSQESLGVALVWTPVCAIRSDICFNH
jgi:hypothetical protein